MKSWITRYVIGIEVTHMLGDRCMGMHRKNCDLVDFVELYSWIILLLSVYSPCVLEIERRVMLEIIHRLHIGTVGIHRGRVSCWIIFFICNYVLSHNDYFHIISQSLLPFIDMSYHHCLGWLSWFLWAQETGEIDDLVRLRAWLWGYLWDRAACRNIFYWFMPWLAFYSVWAGLPLRSLHTHSERRYLLSAVWVPSDWEDLVTVRMELLWGLGDCEEWVTVRMEWMGGLSDWYSESMYMISSLFCTPIGMHN